MILKLWVCTVSFLGPIVLVNCACNLSERQSGCQRNNSNYTDDTSVYSTSAVNCSFAGSLCCYRQGCFDIDMERWNAVNGHASVGQKSFVCGSNSFSVLESPWVTFSTPACVEFAYYRRLPYQLQVFLAFLNGTQPSIKEDHQDISNEIHRTGHFDIEHLTGKIQFRVRGGGGSKGTPVGLDYVTITEGQCLQHASPLQPEASDPSSCDLVTTTLPTTQHTTTLPTTQHTTTLPTTQHTTPSTTTPRNSPSKDASTSSQPPSTRKSTKMTVGDGDSDNNVGVIVGASVAAVAAVVLFVIILIAYRRKVHARKRKGGKRSLIGMSAPAGADNPALSPDDPYELAEDGAPGKTRNSPTDDYTYVGTGESSHQTHHQANETLDEDYSCTGDTQNMAVGAHEKNTAPEKPDPRDVYSVVNKPGKKTPTPVYSLAKIVGDNPTQPNPNDVYSVVNKKGKKPDVAPKPGHSDTEYNTISHKANDNSSQKPAGDATSDTYNRIGGVGSLGSKGQSQESALAEKGSLVDEYNTLDFADTHQNASKNEKRGAARAAYDHVRNDPDDTYSKTQIGKRNVVIGSDYDHVNP